jgi:hypothetical protein
MYHICKRKVINNLNLDFLLTGILMIYGFLQDFTFKIPGLFTQNQAITAFRKGVLPAVELRNNFLPV